MTDLTIPGEAPSVLTRLETVFIEGCPFSGVVKPMLDHQLDALPQPFLDVLFDLPGSVDHTWCAQCDCLTGFVVAAERWDGGDQVEWHPTALVREPNGPVAVLCADCAPYVPDAPDAPATHSAGAA